jgi:hypothetical protein
LIIAHLKKLTSATDNPPVAYNEEIIFNCSVKFEPNAAPEKPCPAKKVLPAEA